jgi:hypothetical protein
MPTVPSHPPAVSQRRLDADEQSFADAWVGLVETYDRQCTDLLMANPLAEFDLVGTRLIDLVDETRGRIADLPPLALTAGEVRSVELEMAATVTLLRMVDPHGPRADQAQQYQLALDHWIERVKPASDAIRAALGLPSSGTGDLRL